jgi:hypothetical protein
MKNRLTCIILNLIIPGLGQLLAGAWTRGVTMIVGALACIVWFVFETVSPLLALYRDDFSGEIEFHYGYMLASLGLLLIIYLWSIADIVFCCEANSDKVKECGNV